MPTYNHPENCHCETCNTYSDKIIMVDIDGGYFLADFKESLIAGSGKRIRIYKQKEYYHELRSVLNDA